jgi:hypothetical protein
MRRISNRKEDEKLNMVTAQRHRVHLSINNGEAVCWQASLVNVR